MKAYIVTGTTRGIGRAIAQVVVASKNQLLSLSSAPDKEEPFWRNIQCDLSQHAGISEQLQRLLKTASSSDFRDMVLINNAGVLDPMGPLQEATEAQIVHHLLVNQAAPAILMSAFIRMTESFQAQRRIINISSGAARYRYSGWAMYCASKAALDMMTLCVSEEQKNSTWPVSVCSVYPGKVETGMQRRIRQSDPNEFPRQPEFVAAKSRGDLRSSLETAQLILALDDAGELKNGGVYDLRGTNTNDNRYSIVPLNSM